ncbi:recombinase family protein [Candidatus Halocynthiibacter alkanivorans]|uniref:recombinase family protein n=1 Tax=Candidatus Halocynthiibacter alkanivorans TaxID=2267619 RepID=UPI000DF44B45|nr:recombinase family protein [Candidatus Halocynthiibacter alkanivorans]
MTKRVAVYARYSSDLQKATSIEDQIAMAERFCTSQGWTIVRVFEDREKSGKDMRRPGFQAMKAAANTQDFDVVVVEAIDRLTRKVKDALSTFDLFTFQNIELHSVQEGAQDFMKVLFAGFGAQMFSQKIADHTRRGMQGAVTRQRLHTRAFGYRRRTVETGLNREIVPEQAEILRRIFSEFSSGRSAQAIAEGLNEDRIPAPNGGSWDGSTLRGNPTRQEGILRNRLYIGIASICRNTHTYHPETGQRKIKPTPQDYVEQIIPELRIINQELWEAVQAELARRAATTPRAARAVRRKTYLLSGLLFCGCCGAPYVFANRTSYRCREAKRSACSNVVPISRKRIEARVFDALRSTFRSESLLERFEDALKVERDKIADGRLEVELKRFEAALAKAISGRDNILVAVAEGAPYASFKAKAEVFETEIASLTVRINKKQAQIQRGKTVTEDARTIYERALKNMEHLLSEKDLMEEAHTYLGMLIEKITLTPDETAQHGLRAEINLSSDTLLQANTASQPHIVVC